MAQFRYGRSTCTSSVRGRPAERSVMAALSELLDEGLLTLLDFVIVSRTESGEVVLTEIEVEDYGLTGIEIGASGLVGESDTADLAEFIPQGPSPRSSRSSSPGRARSPTASTTRAASCCAPERVPAPIVNAVVDAFADAD